MYFLQEKFPRGIGAKHKNTIVAHELFVQASTVALLSRATQMLQKVIFIKGT